MHQRLKWFICLWAQSIKMGEEHSAYTPLWGMEFFNFLLLPCCELVYLSGNEKISVSKLDALNVSAIASACEESCRTSLPVQLSLSNESFSSGDAGQCILMNNDVEPM